jgi:hypothetical protein
MKEEETMPREDHVDTCVLCGDEFVGWGNNPEPLARYEDGKACNICNDTKVIPARLGFLNYKGEM